MSRTYCIACLTCRKRRWIGQGWPHRPEHRYIYGYPEAIKALGELLFAHDRTELLGTPSVSGWYVFANGPRTGWMSVFVVGRREAER